LSSHNLSAALPNQGPSYHFPFAFGDGVLTSQLNDIPC
jgi:hypothetical protein